MTDTDTRPRSEVMAAVAAEVESLRGRLKTIHKLSLIDRAMVIDDVSGVFDKLLHATDFLWGRLRDQIVENSIEQLLIEALASSRPEDTQRPN